ncbi:hypothetical protein AVEN_51002-1 [Araneus ventricosus]|uniref:Uncharacterized protein n=1 Tax=Araneus ventricosus TaxID=182803 RepID=A0A4Y2N844_ARAVE|nr:hypothetical protein AVEN_51002-1 [Araneus ventricosus]
MAEPSTSGVPTPIVMKDNFAKWQPRRSSGWQVNPEEYFTSKIGTVDRSLMFSQSFCRKGEQPEADGSAIRLLCSD